MFFRIDYSVVWQIRVQISIWKFVEPNCIAFEALLAAAAFHSRKEDSASVHCGNIATHF